MIRTLIATLALLFSVTQEALAVDDKYLLIELKSGTVKIEMLPDVAPKHVAQITALAKRGDYDGVASLGVRPMFNGEVPNLETFIFGFSGDLYGADLSVALVEYLRPEETFDSLEAFIAQMDADCARARDILAST